MIYTLRHELAHLLLAPFDQVIRTTREVLKGDDKLLVAMEKIFELALEESLVNIERMLDRGIPKKGKS